MNDSHKEHAMDDAFLAAKITLAIVAVCVLPLWIPLLFCVVQGFIWVADKIAMED